ncbi:MAG: hypothetical protein HY363_04560 [Candidatus Aenigmarchaeota archaeon]|nr:hypothetical protein [Candidatus Aenigmarchaeota archaeon]
MTNLKNLKQLFQAGIMSIAKFPAKNDFDISKLDTLDGYTVPLTKEDYGAKTPVMWNTVYEKLRLNLRNIMVVAQEKDLETITRTFRHDPKYLGGGVAGGFKEVIIKYLDQTIPEDLQSVNIIVKENGRLIGYNTDAQGFVKSLEDTLAKMGNHLNGKHVVLFGAGGVAKEVSKLLAENMIGRLTIINRTYSKAVALAHSLNQKYRDFAFGVPEDLTRGVTLNMINDAKPDIFINSTDKGRDGTYENDAAFAPSGDYNNSMALDLLRQLRAHHPTVIIADIVLTKKEKTPTIHLAELAGFPPSQLLDGNPMVVNQAAPAYKRVEQANRQHHPISKPENEIREIMQEVTL